REHRPAAGRDPRASTTNRVRRPEAAESPARRPRRDGVRPALTLDTAPPRMRHEHTGDENAISQGKSFQQMRTSFHNQLGEASPDFVLRTPNAGQMSAMYPSRETRVVASTLP